MSRPQEPQEAGCPPGKAVAVNARYLSTGVDLAMRSFFWATLRMKNCTLQLLPAISVALLKS